MIIADKEAVGPPEKERVRIFAGGRQSGKATKLVAWVKSRAAKGNYVLVFTPSLSSAAGMHSFFTEKELDLVRVIPSQNISVLYGVMTTTDVAIEDIHLLSTWQVQEIINCFAPVVNKSTQYGIAANISQLDGLDEYNE